MTDRPAVLILGGAGFIGRALAARLAAKPAPVIAATRRAVALGAGIGLRVTGELGAATDWPALLEGTGAVVHLASRAHAPIAAGESDAWIAAETRLAETLGQAAQRAGVERLVLMSSIKVYGEQGRVRPIGASDRPAPSDAYGRAKLAMEQAMAAACGAKLVVLRPPLVYGPGVKANFLALLRLVDRGLPLPLASVDNRRSFVFIGNLLDLVEIALTHPAACGGRFLLRDEAEVSTPQLIAEIARGLGRPARLWRLPPRLLQALARLGGRSGVAERLLGSLRIDDSATRDALGWQPRVPLAEGVAATCGWFRGAALGQAEA